MQRIITADIVVHFAHIAALTSSVMKWTNEEHARGKTITAILYRGRP